MDEPLITAADPAEVIVPVAVTTAWPEIVDDSFPEPTRVPDTADVPVIWAVEPAPPDSMADKAAAPCIAAARLLVPRMVPVTELDPATLDDIDPLPLRVPDVAARPTIEDASRVLPFIVPVTVAAPTTGEDSDPAPVRVAITVAVPCIVEPIPIRPCRNPATVA